MGLYQKYRPETFDEVIGNEAAVKSLQKTVEEKTTHAYLLHGPSGCGKTTLGRIIARELGAKGNDFREVDSADFRGIDTIREMRKSMRYHPVESDVRVFLLDECHKLSNDAQNALLKALEDTPQHVYFILATTDPQKLIPTIKGRTSQYQVSPLDERQMKRLLKKIAKKEEDKLGREILEQIVQDSFGQPRNAIQILEQVLAVDDEEKRLETAKKQAEQQSRSIELCRALLSQNGWKKVSAILKGLKNEDPESIRRHVLGYAQSVLLNGDNEIAGLVLEEMIEPFYNSGFPGLVYACYSIVKQ
jgi:DNA polymerase-3 subunit gamma/tau